MTPEQIEQVRKDMKAPSVGWLAQLPRLAPTTCGEDVFAVAGLTEEAICSVRQLSPTPRAGSPRRYCRPP